MMNLTPRQVERFWSKIDRSGGPDACWPFVRPAMRSGYAQVQMSGRTLYAHRVAYELSLGPIPSGLTIDHLCRVRHCANPAHLEPVTIAENIRRARRGIDGRPLTVCGNGHPWTSENTLWKWKGEYLVRDCRACRRAYQAAYRARRLVQS